MKTLETVLCALMVIYFLVYIILALCCKKPFKTLFLMALAGVGTLALIDLTAKYTGVYIPINPYTVGISAAAGLPGTIMLLVLNLIFGI